MRRIQHYITDQLEHYFRIDARYFFSGAVWLTIIQAITVFGALIVSVVTAHILSEANYGTYRYILGTGALLSALSLTGIGQSIFQTAARGHSWFYRIGIYKSNLYGIGLTFCSFLASCYYFLQGNTLLGIGCVLIALFQPLLNTYQQIFPFLQGTKRFKESTILQGLKTVIITGATLGTVFLTQNILWLVLAYFLSNTIVNFVVHIVYAPKKTGPIDTVVEQRYISYAYNTSIRNILSILAFRIDSVIVFQQLGATQLAIYTIANIIPEHIKASFKNIITLLVPKYAQHENLDTIKKSMMKRSLQLFLIFTTVTIAYIIVSPHVYKLLFPKYGEAVLLSQLLALSFPAMIALIPLSALQAHTQERELTLLNTQSSLAMIIVTMILTVTHGILGAISARIISRYINLFLAYFYMFRSKK